MKSFSHAYNYITVTAGSILLGCFPCVTNALTKEETGLPDTIKAANLQSKDLATFVGGALGVVLGIIGVVFLIMLVYGGFLWMIGGDDEKKVSKARELILYSVLGLIVIISAGAITRFIITDSLLGL